MNRRFWAVEIALILLLGVLAGCQTTVPREELARDYYNIGNAYFDLAQFEKAAEYYNRSLELDASINQAVFNLARTRLETGDYEDALQLLSDLEVQDPENLLVLEMIGYTWYQMGQADRAARYYRMVLDIHSVNRRALYNICQLEKQKKNWGIARYYLEQLMSLEDKPEYRVLLAELSVEEEDFEHAISYYEDLLVENQGNAEIYKSLKELYLETERYYKALEMIDLLIGVPDEAALVPEYLFEKSRLEFLSLDDMVSGQRSLLEALKKGFRDKERLDELAGLVDPVFQEQVERIILENLQEEEPGAYPESVDDAETGTDEVD